MDIKRFGKNCLQIKGKKETVWIDPETEKVSGRIVVETKNEQVKLSSDDRIVVAGPGEYEIGGVEIAGISAGENGTFYTIVVDGVTVAVLGELPEELSDKKSEKVTAVDVLVASIHNGKGIAGKQFGKLAKQWGANIMIPIGYEKGDEDIKKFLDEMDNEGMEESESVKIDKDNLPEGHEVIMLKSN